MDQLSDEQVDGLLQKLYEDTKFQSYTVTDNDNFIVLENAGSSIAPRLVHWLKHWDDSNIDGWLKMPIHHIIRLVDKALNLPDYPATYCTLDERIKWMLGC